MNKEIIKQRILKSINDQRVNHTEATICARDIHDDLNLKDSCPSVCNAMREIFRTGDKIVNLPRKRIKGGYLDRQVCDAGMTFDEQSLGQSYKGAILTIKYKTETMRQAG